VEKLLTVKELAERLGLAPGSLYHWLSEGRLPCVRFSSRCVRFREKDVEELIEKMSSSKWVGTRNRNTR
jgi:excisionase family DNA binding protein